ncbi:MAG: radical SAM protein, partial [Hydrogenophaga sp.]
MNAPFRVLSLIPPMTQLNTPYPSTAYLTGFLRSRGVDAVQADLALALVLKLFTPEGLDAVRGEAQVLDERDRSGSVHAFLDQFDSYRATIGPVIRFLQGRDSTLAHRIAARGLLPEGPRFGSLDAYEDDGTGDPLAWAFGALGVQDKARHLCTLYLNDLADVLRDAELAMYYAKRLGGDRIEAYRASARSIASYNKASEEDLERGMKQ